MELIDYIIQHTYSFEFDVILKLFIAFIVGGVIGYTRTMSGKPAGMRTHMLLCIGATLLTAISIHLKDIYYSPNADPARLMSQIVTGIGFVGGGVIIKSERKVMGVTTAAVIWVTASIGISIGSGMYLVSLAMLGFILLLEPIAKLQFMTGLKAKPYMLKIKTKNVNRVINYLHNSKIREYGQESTNGDTTIYIHSSYQKNSDLEVAFSKMKVSFKLNKISSQDFE